METHLCPSCRTPYSCTDDNTCAVKRHSNGLLFQSQLPSGGPVRHLSSQREQSNTGLPSFTLTLLCARHSHCPKSSRLATRGASFAMYPWKSSAQTQHGYKREKSRTKLTRSDCCVRDGASGYCAAMLWSRVHELRPSCSTSGGHSRAGFLFAVALIVLSVLVAVGLSVLNWCVACAAKAEKADLELQLRQL